MLSCKAVVSESTRLVCREARGLHTEMKKKKKKKKKKKGKNEVMGRLYTSIAMYGSGHGVASRGVIICYIPARL